MRLIHCMILVSMLVFTLGTFAQQLPKTQSQEATDAVQSQRLDQLEQASKVSIETIAALAREAAALRSSMDKFIGIGIGIGTCITALQGVLIIVTWKKK